MASAGDDHAGAAVESHHRRRRRGSAPRSLQAPSRHWRSIRTERTWPPPTIKRSGCGTPSGTSTRRVSSATPYVTTNQVAGYLPEGRVSSACNSIDVDRALRVQLHPSRWYAAAAAAMCCSPQRWARGTCRRRGVDDHRVLVPRLRRAPADAGGVEPADDVGESARACCAAARCPPPRRAPRGTRC